MFVKHKVLPKPHKLVNGTDLIVSQLVFNVHFQHKYMAKSGTKSQGWRATQYRKASEILTSTLAAFLFSSHPKRERDREAHLNYYTSANNRKRQLQTTRHK